MAGYWDTDIVNCYPSIYGIQAQRFGIDTPQLNLYLRDRDGFVAVIAKAMRCNNKKIKAAILAVQHYGGESGVIDAAGFTHKQAMMFLTLHPVKELRKEFRLISDSWISETRRRPGRELINAIGKGIVRNSKPPTVISHLLCGIESQIMEVCRKHYHRETLLLMHDGFVTENAVSESRLQKLVFAELGYSITFNCTQIQPPIQPKIERVKLNSDKGLKCYVYSTLVCIKLFGKKAKGEGVGWLPSSPSFCLSFLWLVGVVPWRPVLE